MFYAVIRRVPRRTRRWLLPRLLTTLMVVGVAGPASADQAVTFQINLAHTGVTATTGLVPPLAQKWSVAISGAPSYAIIANGEVYVAVSDTTSDTTDIYGLSQVDGHTIWGPVSVKASTYAGGFPAYDSGKLFVVDDDGYVVALNATTGKQQWGEQMPLQYSFSSPPTAHAGMLYVVGAGEGGTLYAVNESNGQIQWTASVENGDSSSPCVTPSAVYVSFVGPQTDAFDPASGSLLWSYSADIEGGGGATPVFSEGDLYILDAQGFASFGYRMDGGTGVVRGTFDSQQPPAIDGNKGYLVLHDAIQAENMKTQAILWTAEISGESIVGSPVVVNHVVYCVTSANELRGFNEGTGEAVFSTQLNDVASGRGLNAAQGLLVVPTSTHLIAFH